ncbi:FAD-linked oxidoreductase-like protein [Diplogelasinospora grovesii]|uniref:Proline dehydrogenase n=1 Tax=Diplogelasinospora grovesii TaxID=303347 RepID=A0AAN6N117_9PEZI|nr:FAD-linked oxidoreductase-like protein [Diplogelasinospora grovesii]
MVSAQEIEAARAEGRFPTQSEIDELYRNSRLSIPAGFRIPLASGLSFLVGLGLGTAQGSKMAGLRFRAEHAHKLPTTTTGWFLYHKSKNYHVAYGGLREGLRMGAKVCFWTTAMFGIEHMFDSYRRTADLLNTVTACVTVAGGFSLWSMQDPLACSAEGFHSLETSSLAVLPLANILRSLTITSISSSPLLLPPSLAIMSVLAHTTNPILNPDKNPILRYFLKKTFYAQFCAGENGSERIGFSGVILGYAKETCDLASCGEGAAAEECVRTEINPWAAGTMETVMLASRGDFVALKFTGAGRQALYTLSQRLPPSEALAAAIDNICQLAASRGVRLVFDAEQHAVQAGIDDWTLNYMRKYNTQDRAVVYGTYQAYLKATPATLSRHLAVAHDEGFTLGVKLVRGAYLGSDPRHLIYDTKAETDAAYDAIADALLRRQWIAPLQAPPARDNDGKPVFPSVNMVLASHNRDSVLKARATLDAGDRSTEVAFAQLQGMADEVSCELVSTNDAAGSDSSTYKPQAYKYLVWGSTGECMKYLLRRAQENRDAVQRTRSGRDAMRAELVRRTKALFGLT